MKKVILGSVAAVAAVSTFSAHAVTASICTNSNVAAPGTAVAVGGFVKTAFTPKCSANVWAYGDDQTSYYGSGAASSKGKNVFQGSTAGGGVRASTSCAAATGCTSTEAQTAASTAPAS